MISYNPEGILSLLEYEKQTNFKKKLEKLQIKTEDQYTNNIELQVNICQEYDNYTKKFECSKKVKNEVEGIEFAFDTLKYNAINYPNLNFVAYLFKSVTCRKDKVIVSIYSQKITLTDHAKCDYKSKRDDDIR